MPGTGIGEVLPVQRRHRAQLRGRAPVFRPGQHRHRPAPSGLPAPHPRSKALLRGRDPCRMAPVRHRCPGPDGRAVHLSRSRQPRRHLLVPVRRARAHGVGRRAPGCQVRGTAMTALAPTLQAFFTDRLIGQRGASPHTIAAYRDTFRLLLGFAAEQARKQPSELDLDDLSAPLIGAFLDHLEASRRNSVRTRNNRLAAIHSLFGYAALRHPEHAATIQRVLAIPPTRSNRNLLTYLTDDEADALAAASDLTTWTGRRDHAMIVLAIQTGLRISELTGLTIADITLGRGANVHCLGKGRKERRTPLTPATVTVLRAWLAERDGSPSEPLFPTITGRRLSRDAIEHRITLYTRQAGDACPSIRAKHVTTHTLRHTAAMRLLLSGTDITVIALWLGHEQVTTTSAYLHADMTQKERAIARTTPLATKPGRYRPSDTVLAFLQAL